MKSNIFTYKPVFTHEGAPSSNVSPLQKLKRMALACMLWEDSFYVDGKTIADQLAEVCTQVNADKILELAVKAHKDGLLRHLPLYLILQALKKGGKAKEAIYEVCTRPDQMTELVSLYWKQGKKPIPAQMKKGLAKAFTRFDEYQLAKYNRNEPIKLRDILFLCHAKPKDEEQAALWKRLISNTLKTPETWEVKLSAGQDKKESFQELLEKGKMGKLAILRNLRNMQESGVPLELVTEALMKKSRPLLPFQFLAAAKACPQWEFVVDASMVQSASQKEKLLGHTAVLVDVSGSMIGVISKKSKMDRRDAACGLAILLREVCEKVMIFSFSNYLSLVPSRQGMALRDAIFNSQPNSSTELGNALMNLKTTIPFDRIIVITDEQASDNIPKITIPKAYILNIASYENGIKDNGQWTTISGFSENSIDFIYESEKENEQKTEKRKT